MDAGGPVTDHSFFHFWVTTMYVCYFYNNPQESSLKSSLSHFSSFFFGTPNENVTCCLSLL